MDWILNPDIWLSLVTLTALEIVLGIDNLVFIAILVAKLPAERQRLARQLGLMLALLTRLALLFTLSWLAGLSRPLFTVLGEGISWRDIVLIGGGLFLIAKATFEIHHKVEAAAEEAPPAPAGSFMGVVAQIAIIDIVFSFDSVLTAVGMAQYIEVMVAAIVISMVLMLVASGPVSGFVDRHPTIKMLALAFLILIGTMLTAEGIGFHIPKGYIYFAMAFAVLVEGLNTLVRRQSARARAQRAPRSPGE
ncbi:MAG TPA: TerC family protein [Alphaproteobacteria bacterium]|jgi:predicted tellurium resistance membrane protein TerC